MKQEFKPEIQKFLNSTALFKGMPKQKLAEIYEHIQERSFHSHDVVYYKGEISDNLYIVRYGEIVLNLGPNGDWVRYLGPGEVLAEQSLLMGSSHTATARSAMDSLVYILEGKYFLQIAEKEPVLSRNLVGLLVHRMKEMVEGTGKEEKPRRLICHIPLEPIEDFKKKLQFLMQVQKMQLHTQVKSINIQTLKGQSDSQIISKLSEMRRQSPVIHLYFPNPKEVTGMGKIVAQTDQIVFWESDTERFVNQKQETLDFWAPRIRNFSGRAIRYIDSPVHQVPRERLADQKVFQRGETFARYLINRTRGIALGGGGARAMAHVGLLKVMEQEKIQFDFVSGASFGAVIGALYARGDNVESIYKTIQKFFGGAVKPFDPTIPLVSFFKGRIMIRMLQEAFGNQMIEELPIPFVTSAVDIRSGEEYVFQAGPVWEALAATMSLPGVFPPRFHGERVLIDGGVLNNVPANLLRELGADTILAINVSPLRDEQMVHLLEDRNLTDKSFFRRLYEDIRYPPILKIMSRANTLEGREITKLRQDEMDLFLHLHVEEFGLFDFGRYDAIIEKGEDDARRYLAEIRDLFRLDRGKDQKSYF